MDKRGWSCSIVIFLIIAIFISGCTSQTNNPNTFRADDSFETRDYTFYNCQHLVNQTVNFTGKIIFEECGKNCLGDCGYPGPDYCYYGVQDKDNCTVYIPSRIDALGNPKFKDAEKTFNQFDIGETIQLQGVIRIYYDLHCSGLFTCNYFMLDVSSAV